ncbi:MAG: hypothetical protein DRN91_07100 [Candidatus Alkanophagales archaeon]|nr:MAG: hypothetical protein DRN91_07100 [Candidatus Alkanophagales archaeon]
MKCPKCGMEMQKSVEHRAFTFWYCPRCAKWYDEDGKPIFTDGEKRTGA